MGPLLIASLVSGAISAGATAYQNYKQGLIDEEEYKSQLAAANKLEADLKKLRPSDTWEDINPKLLGEVAKYNPEIANFVEENAPEKIKESVSLTEKRTQREALKKYSAMAETGRDVISDAQREQALFEADARAKQRRQQLTEGLKRQGQLGSGAALAAQLQGQEAEAVSARQASLQGVQEAEARRRQALGQAASLAGSIRGQNLQVESANVNTMNAFNERMANAKNLYNRYSTGEKNKAQLINQQRQMDREKYNLGLENQYALYNRQQKDAAVERARQYDADLVGKMYDVRGGAEKFRRDADARERAGYATSLNTGLGTAMGVYSMGSKGMGNLAESATQGAVQGVTSNLTASQEPNWNDQSEESIDFSSDQNLNDNYTSPTFEGPPKPEIQGPPRPAASQTKVYESFIPMSFNKGISGRSDHEDEMTPWGTPKRPGKGL